MYSLERQAIPYWNHGSCRSIVYDRGLLSGQSLRSVVSCNIYGRSRWRPCQQLLPCTKDDDWLNHQCGSNYKQAHYYSNLHIINFRGRLCICFVLDIHGRFLGGDIVP